MKKISDLLSAEETVKILNYKTDTVNQDRVKKLNNLNTDQLLVFHNALHTYSIDLTVYNLDPLSWTAKQMELQLAAVRANLDLSN